MTADRTSSSVPSQRMRRYSAGPSGLIQPTTSYVRTPAASSSATKSAANSRGPTTAIRASRPSSRRTLIQAPSAVTSQAPKTTASYSVAEYEFPAASAISQAAAAPATGANRPSSTRLAGIRCSGSWERSIACVAMSMQANTIKAGPSFCMCRYAITPAAAEGPSRSVNQSIIRCASSARRPECMPRWSAPRWALFSSTEFIRTGPRPPWPGDASRTRRATGHRRRRRAGRRPRPVNGSELPLEVVALGEPAAGGVGLPRCSWPTGYRHRPNAPRSPWRASAESSCTAGWSGRRSARSPLPATRAPRARAPRSRAFPVDGASDCELDEALKYRSP